jgi:hypothetical protein
MWKKVLLASAVTGLLAGAAIPIHPNTAYAAHSGCAEAAKMKFPGRSHRAQGIQALVQGPVEAL